MQSFDNEHDVPYWVVEIRDDLISKGYQKDVASFIAACCYSKIGGIPFQATLKETSEFRLYLCHLR
mgnify:FL=1